MRTEKELRVLRVRLKRYIESFTYPPPQLDLAFDIGISQTVISLFLGRPKYRLSNYCFGKIEEFLSKKEVGKVLQPQTR